jgi:hypothetical protein
LQVICVEQKRSKLLAAETSGDIARPQRRFDDHADVLQRSVANEVAVVVIYGFEVIEIHHQDAKRFGRLFRTRRLAPEFAEKGLAGQQTGKFVVTEQTLNLLLKSAIDLIEQLKAKELIADEDLVAVPQNCFGHGTPINQGTVG